ncbi:MAG: diguanylate cyclase [Oscillospiraceae bacterium]|jgi:diguanylate cyclase (GGDEF)-like protein|nr:diguanylate cyclase [Oscillospiraceae bacterium]
MSEKKEFTILTTDDEKSNLDILAGILSPYYNILVSKSGARTLELAREKKPDLILLDVMMPEMTGFEVIAALKASNATANIPVIFITGLSSTEDEQRGFFLGAVDYITKPFNNAIVKARVNTHMKIVDQMRTIERIGLIDPLTKIANRRGFEDRFEAEWGRAIREKEPISFLIMDIDLFKIYNDTYGHQQGDVALKLFAETAIDSLLRASDFAARWGGEEFVVLLPFTNIDGATEIAERIRLNIEAMEIPIDEESITKVTVSIGANSIVPDIDSSMKDFIEKADLALYKAKELGRNRIVSALDL